MNCSTPGLPVHHQLPESTQTHVHWVGDAIQPSHPLSSPSPPALNLSQHQSLFKWVSSSHEVAKVIEFQLQHQSYQWTPRTDLLMYQHTALMYSFPSFEPVCCSMSCSNCCFFSCIQISQEASKTVQYFHLFQNFPQFVVIHTVKGFSGVNEA